MLRLAMLMVLAWALVGGMSQGADEPKNVPPLPAVVRDTWKRPGPLLVG